MRQSKREVALEAAKRIVQRDGVTALSYEAVAAEAELTKGGLQYHFPSREDLLLALHTYVADQWEQCMIRELGQDDGARPDEETKTAAYVRASQNPDRAELLLTLEAATQNTAASEVWNGVYDRWAAQEPAAAEDDDAVRRFIARLAADGLWFYESIAPGELQPEVRERLVEEIIALGQEPIA